MAGNRRPDPPTLLVGLLADPLPKSGRLKEAGASLAEASAAAEQNEETWWNGELHRVRGELFLAAPANATGDGAEHCLRQAIVLARQQGAKSLELRAGIYGWFTEGFDTADLNEAKALLDELSQ